MNYYNGMPTEEIRFSLLKEKNPPRVFGTRLRNLTDLTTGSLIYDECKRQNKTLEFKETCMRKLICLVEQARINLKNEERDRSFRVQKNFRHFCNIDEDNTSRRYKQRVFTLPDNYVKGLLKAKGIEITKQSIKDKRKELVFRRLASLYGKIVSGEISKKDGLLQMNYYEKLKENNYEFLSARKQGAIR